MNVPAKSPANKNKNTVSQLTYFRLFAGLSAACVLKEEGLDVIVLEARDRVGGRTYTVKVRSGVG